jgi:hypothetical protein
MRYEVSIIGAGLRACTSSTGCASSDFGARLRSRRRRRRHLVLEPLSRSALRLELDLRFSFSDELLQEWDWSEHFSAQPETLRYCNHVADKFDLRRDITFNSRVVSAAYDQNSNEWELAFEDGRRVRSRFLVTRSSAVGATLPAIPGMMDFAAKPSHRHLAAER